MQWNLLRDNETDHSTTGLLFIDGIVNPICHTLEPSKTFINDEGKVGLIPPGTYPLKMLWSNRFQRLLPHITDVPNRSDLMIHNGNTWQDTEGCVLVGTTLENPDFIGHSKDALENILKQIESIQGDMFIQIRYV